MKKNIHPSYEPLVIRDKSAGVSFLTRSTVKPASTVSWDDGNTYPVLDVAISSASHPYYTGEQRIFDPAGQVERFYRRYGS